MASQKKADDSTVEKKPFPLLLVLAICVGVVLLGCGGAGAVAALFYWKSAKNGNSSPATSSAVTTPLEQNPVPALPEDTTPPIDGQGIVDAYAENSIAADAKYKGKKCTFLMTIKEVGRFDGRAMIGTCTPRHLRPVR
jgi:hypothetical protein